MTTVGGVVADTGQELERRGEHAPATVTPEDEPSAEWGWHGTFPHGQLIAGWISVAVMFLFLIGNHQGKVEDLWLIGVGVVMAAGLVRHQIKRRNSWRR